METLRERLDAVASIASASVDQAAVAGSSALTAVQTQHSSYAQSAQQACPVPPHLFCIWKGHLARTRPKLPRLLKWM